jgi:hypothetical protein
MSLLSVALAAPRFLRHTITDPPWEPEDHPMEFDFRRMPEESPLWNLRWYVRWLVIAQVQSAQIGPMLNVLHARCNEQKSGMARPSIGRSLAKVSALRSMAERQGFEPWVQPFSRTTV